MGFRENLKAQLEFADMYVKELAALSGVKKQTIDSYLSTHNCTPSADAAVKIARVLGVSVEFLVTGCETVLPQPLQPLSAEMRLLTQTLQRLSDEHRKIVLKSAITLSGLLQEHESNKV
ncbi:MAG: helix-turn-helix domain-containing protein [Treponema sp.]|jgi:transcriptional regulator with XRE-family HTH domain|nr:helix-turn-helix domain-containing protein [Treponema sp.]